MPFLNRSCAAPLDALPNTKNARSESLSSVGEEKILRLVKNMSMDERSSFSQSLCSPHQGKSSRRSSKGGGSRGSKTSRTSSSDFGVGVPNIPKSICFNAA